MPSKKQEKITEKKSGSKIWMIAIFALIIVAAITLYVVISPSDKDNSSTLPTDLIEKNDPILGDANAPISIIEFSDFECPYCQLAYAGAISEFKDSDYLNNGNVNLVYKQFPLNSIHPFAQKAAEASLCAQEQGKFWEYHDTLFENQNALTVSNLKQYALSLNINPTQFNACLDDGKYEAEVLKEFNLGVSLNIGGAPTFIILNKETEKGLVLEGAYPWSDFEGAIKEIQ